MKLENILPKNGPSIEEVKKYIEKYNNEIIVIKCGGSVLLEENLFEQFINDVSILNQLKINIIVVHGGGKNIKKKLDDRNIESKFIDGLRITDEKTIIIVEQALIELNLDIVQNKNTLLINYESDLRLRDFSSIPSYYYNIDSVHWVGNVKMGATDSIFYKINYLLSIS